jgi:hypothetical protein
LHAFMLHVENVRDSCFGLQPRASTGKMTGPTSSAPSSPRQIAYQHLP